MDNKVKNPNIYTRNKNYVIMFFLFIISTFIFSFVYKEKIVPVSQSKNYNIYMNAESKALVGPLQKDYIVKQEFVADEDFSGIGLNFATQSRVNEGELTIKLLEKSNDRLIQSWTLDASQINEGYNYFALDNNISKSNKKYEIIINSNSEEEDKSLVLYSSQKDNYKSGNLTINNTVENYDISFCLVSVGSNFIKAIFISFYLIFIILLLVVYYMAFMKKSKIENIFLVISILLGISYMFLCTPYSNYDEPAHMDTAYRYSNVLLGKGFSTESGGLLRREEDNMNGLTPAKTTIDTYKTTYDGIFDIAQSTDLEDVGGRAVAEAFYVYAPDTLGITVARIFHLGKIPTILLARLFNLITFISLIYFSIRKIPFGKILLLVLSLIPMSLVQASSLSYDSMIIGISYLFTSYCLYLAFENEKNIKKRDYIIFFIALALLAPLKIVYVFLCSLALIIPKSRFKSKNKYTKFIIGTISLTIMSFLIINASRAFVNISSTENVSVFGTEAYSFSDIINNPFNFIIMIFNTIVERGESFIKQAITGIYMVDISTLITIGFIGIIILSAFRSEDEKQYIEKKHKLLFGLIVLVILLLLHIVAVTWTPIGHNIIEGVQGRYIIPILIILCMIIRNSNLVYKKNINKQLILSLVILQGITLVSAFINIVS